MAHLPGLLPQWPNEAFDDGLIGIFATLWKVDGVVDVDKCLHGLLDGHCGKSAKLLENIQEVFCVANIEPLLLLPFYFVELRNVEIDADSSIIQAHHADTELSEVVLSTGCDQNRTVASLHVDYVVGRLPKL